MKAKLYEEYWNDIMENRRMFFHDEVNRLARYLLGHLHTHNMYCEKTNQKSHKMDALEFWSSKRPYGNKDIEASIAYGLGWDYKRILTTSDLPEFVRVEARKLHEEVKIELAMIEDIS